VREEREVRWRREWRGEGGKEEGAVVESESEREREGRLRMSD